MAGVNITVDVGAAPQSGTQVIHCSAPADLTTFQGLSAVGPGSGFVSVTEANSNKAKLVGVARIVSVDAA